MIQRWATFTDDRLHRHTLGRRWAPGPYVLFIGLNPSTADEEHDDPTVRRCIGFARAWGYGAVVICNLFSLRATDPRQLEHGNAISSWNRAILYGRAVEAAMVVAAWGANKVAHQYVAHGGLGAAGLGKLALSWYCLGRTRAGDPRHPLYVRADTEPEPWLTDLSTERR